jgi:hypothetical protein
LKPTVKRILTLFSFILLFIIGYIRESIFLVINSVLNNYPFPYNPSYIPPPDYLFSLTTQELINLKWVFTITFSSLYMLFSWLIIYFYFQSKKFTKIVFYIYTILIVITSLIICTGLLFNCFDLLYTPSRFIVGIIQSPLLVIVLFTLFYLLNDYNRKGVNYLNNGR